ncbi:Gfo/Idh/MocA family oxidoreductase [Lentisphaera marina]|uniref:Gfo/Idh/MocA family protein n=1 Tax=Lentisphaera marina TaxID=1111041 RepID=UPI0023657520|nr:Gfo/Idh/MocA family oxidoreductase [Lentisphaera marina]MDD7984651.1 Gfo/Idh/MocA family oxidoreductase [Lentisphaera marina]
MKKIKLALWGDNGHQIYKDLELHPEFELVVIGSIAESAERDLLKKYSEAKLENDYEKIIHDYGVEMISLCSEYRSEQADLAVRALDKGIHVYAEKPCALSEKDLDRIIASAAKSKGLFHEMAGTLWEEPYWSMRKIVQSGQIGEVVQVLAQKSYPYADWRPRNEKVDGGLVAQVGVHAVRFVEHVAEQKIKDIHCQTSTLGEVRKNSELKMAANFSGRLENGGLYSCIANYLHNPGMGNWGNEMLRIFGTKGMIESCDAGRRTRMIIGDKDFGDLDLSDEKPDFLDEFIKEICEGRKMLLSLEEELSPTRWMIRANFFQ